jgi:hypothetical protein
MTATGRAERPLSGSLASRKIKRLDKRLNHANRIVLINKIIKRFGKKRALTATQALYKPLHPHPPTNDRRSIPSNAFLHSLGHKRQLNKVAESVRCALVTGHTANYLAPASIAPTPAAFAATPSPAG